MDLKTIHSKFDGSSKNGDYKKKQTASETRFFHTTQRTFDKER
jgi:hypothetical protein